MEQYLNKILNDDCMNVLRNIPSKSIDLVLTDPPYDGVNRESAGLRNLDKGKADIVEFDYDAWLNEIVRVCRGSVYIFCGHEQISQIFNKLNAHKFSTRLMVWEKTNPSPMNGEYIWLSGIEPCVYGKRASATYNGFCQNTVLRCDSEKQTIHPTQKPIDLFAKLVRTSSNPGDIVLDTFSGSGTTAVVCYRLKRKFICVEKDKEFWAKSQERLQAEWQQLEMF